MRQVLVRCKASKADNVVAYFEAFAKQRCLKIGALGKNV